MEFDLPTIGAIVAAVLWLERRLGRIEHLLRACPHVPSDAAPSGVKHGD